MKRKSNARVSLAGDVSVRSGGDRSVFAVARANAILAAELPSVVYQGRKSLARPSERSALSLRPAGVPRPSDVVRAPQRLNSEPMRADARPSLSPVADAPLRLEKPEDRQTCKSRPDDTRRKGSGGGSRPFVPWCSKRS